MRHTNVVTSFSHREDKRKIKQGINVFENKYQGPVVQSIVSLTSSLRGQLVKCFTAL